MSHHSTVAELASLLRIAHELTLIAYALGGSK